MKIRLVQIGNSRGIRIPKALIDQVGLSEEVELEVRAGTILIRPVIATRAGWAAAATQLATTGEGLRDPPASTRFDREDWSW